MSIFEELAQRATDAGGKLTVRSALNPMLWMCGIVTAPAVVASLRIEPTPWWLEFLIVAPVAATVLGFLALLVFDRDKLQSEEYQIKKRTLEIYEQKGMSTPLHFQSQVAIPPPPITSKFNSEDQE